MKFFAKTCTESHPIFQRQFAKLVAQGESLREWAPLSSGLPAKIHFHQSKSAGISGRWRVGRAPHLPEFGWGGAFLELLVDQQRHHSWKALAFDEILEDKVPDTAHVLAVCKATGPLTVRFELSARPKNEGNKIVLASRHFFLSQDLTPLFLRADDLRDAVRSIPEPIRLRLNLYLEAAPKFGIKMIDFRFHAY